MIHRLEGHLHLSMEKIREALLRRTRAAVIAPRGPKLIELDEPEVEHGKGTRDSTDQR